MVIIIQTINIYTYVVLLLMVHVDMKTFLL